MSKEKMDSQGKITITEEALVSLILKAISEVEMVKAPSRLSASRQIKVDFEPEKNQVDVFLKLAFSSARPLQETARKIQEKVRDALETAAGLKVKKIELEVTHLSD